MSGEDSGPEQPLTFWRTLDELRGSAAFRERLHNEFVNELPVGEPRTPARREFLRLMAASLAVAGSSACTRQPVEYIVPYVRQPEQIVPGRPLFYATAAPLGGIGTGVLAESHEGRPTKIEGNPEHPGSLGAADVFSQAAILDLYDPDRAQALTNLGEIRSWGAFLAAVRAAAAAQKPVAGRGLRILTESVSSPTLAWQIRALLAAFPEARWHQWDPASPQAARMGARLAFGEMVDVQYRFAGADVVLSLESDFLASGPGCLRYAREFLARRRPEAAAEMNRFYAVECMPTPTGARADHRLPLKPSEILVLTRRLAAAVGVHTAGQPEADEHIRRFAETVARELLAHRGRSIVIAGEGQPPQVHALAQAMNVALGNVGRTVIYTEPIEAQPVDHLESLRELVADMAAGEVDLLVVVGGNPVFTAPADVDFRGALSRVQLRIRLGLYEDETSELCHWHVPEAHFLESWSDVRAYDGTASIIQPLIDPLYEGRSAHELLATLTDRPERRGRDIVREFWASNPPADAGYASVPAGTSPDAAFETVWRRWLHDGLVPATALPSRAVTLRAGFDEAVPEKNQDGDFEIAFRNDPTVLDGRFGNNGWLQELPKPITRLTWDNAVLASPATAARLEASNTPAWRGGEHGQIVCTVVEVRHAGRTVSGALFAVPGHPDGAITVHAGYGRWRAGSLGSGPGFNAGGIRTASGYWYGAGATVTRTGDRMSLACTQHHHLMEGRHLVRAVTRDEWMHDPASMREGDETPPRTLTLFPEHAYDGYKWGMAIDVNACTGCNACVVACQAENNIPVIGKDEVLKGREMHWLRVDTYYRGPEENPETYFQPVPCMQCENAPCEVVCPVAATTHSDEGLNDMVYNRCVGTRYCANNCPYKVRRFNYLLYQDWDTPSLKLGRNPDVTVRSRGVMEKCTYCVQRINQAKIQSEKEDRRVRDGEIRTACQQTCPADAIVFGDLNDKNSRVSQLKASERNYELLGELNTRPRTTYLGAVRNTNEDVER